MNSEPISNRTPVSRIVFHTPLRPRSWLLVCGLFLWFAAGLAAAERPNVLFIAIDDLRNELGSLGADHAKTPHLDHLAATARVFDHHFVHVPTCGASRCALLRGQYPSARAHLGNNGILETSRTWADRSLPGVFRAHGYRTLALGKISHYPGGRSGKNWAEGGEELPGVWDRCWIPDSPWPTPLAMMHGYANGKARTPGVSPPWEAHDGPDEAYPDAWVAAEAITTLTELAQGNDPWFFAVGFFKPHLPFSAPQRWHDLHDTGLPELPPDATAKPSWPSGWHASGEFRGNYGHPDGDPIDNPEVARRLRQAYAASVSYMDAQVGRVLDRLDELGLAENTIVVVWGDHGFLLGEHAIWGKHCLFEHALRSPLMIRAPRMTNPGATSHAIVETVDLFPTLMDLCNLPAPEELDGTSLCPQLLDPSAPSAKPAYGFSSGGERTIRTGRWRLIAQPTKVGERIELFDYETDPFETRNHATEHPEVVAQLREQLAEVPAVE